MEARAGAKGNADQQSTPRTQRRDRVSHVLERMRQAVFVQRVVKPKVGAVCGKAPRTTLCGRRIVVCIPTVIHHCHPIICRRSPPQVHNLLLCKQLVRAGA
jgi:hypothetical protein